MKKKAAIVLFVISTLLFLILAVISVDFIFACINHLNSGTNDDFLNAIILVTIYSSAILIVSVPGLTISIFSTKISQNKFIKICSGVQIATFAIAILFSVFQSFIRFR